MENALKETDLARTTPNIFRLQFFNINMIILNDIELIQMDIN